MKYILLGICTALLGWQSTSFAALADGSCQPGQQSQVVTAHVATIAGKPIPYTATVGFVEVMAHDKSSKACIFYTSYVVTPAAGAGPRPLTFAFNGGPGSASLWLHLGLLGPKRVDLGSDGLSTSSSHLAPIDNPESPLDLSDLVIIDPVATGFSFAENGAAASPFFGVLNDYTSIESFIVNFLDQNNRWESPKFVMGESYGGTRGSLLAHHLQQDYGIALQGLILVSPALSNSMFAFGSSDLTPYWTYFPNFAATAWYHHKISTAYAAMDVETVYSEAKKFAWDRLRNVLEAGTDADPQARAEVADGIAAFTGLSHDLILERDLRITPLDIFAGLLQKEREMVGRYDSRFTAPVETTGSFEHWIDPSSTFPSYAFTAGINQYLRVDLGFKSASPYADSADITGWPEDDARNGATAELSAALAINPHLRVMIASGYFDLACPMAAVDHELSIMPRAKEFASRIQHTRYSGGHMMYINPPALHALKQDLSAFYTMESSTAIHSQK